MPARMKQSTSRLLSILGVSAALMLFASLGNATTVVLCPGTPEFPGGEPCVDTIPTSSPALFVASDGEGSFDPFGFGADTSDGIQLNSGWAPDPSFASAFAPGFWTQIADPATGGFTWVLPAVTPCGVENEPSCEPVAKWYFTSGGQWNAGTPDILLIFEGAAFASDLSDVILVNNTGPNGSASITFYSDPATFPSIPEPASLALLGIGMAGLAFARRRKS